MRGRRKKDSEAGDQESHQQESGVEWGSHAASKAGRGGECSWQCIGVALALGALFTLNMMIFASSLARDNSSFIVPPQPVANLKDTTTPMPAIVSSHTSKHLSFPSRKSPSVDEQAPTPPRPSPGTKAAEERQPSHVPSLQPVEISAEKAEGIGKKEGNASSPPMSINEQGALWDSGAGALNRVATQIAEDSTAKQGQDGPKKYRAGDFPIAVIAYNRPEYLKRCLETLLAASMMVPAMVTVFQDGADGGVARVAKEAGVQLERHERIAGREGAQNIAAHYGWALNRMFEVSKEARYGIVLEEDMIVAPDFLAYFLRLAPAMDADPTLYCISAYNDNGLSHLVEDTGLVYRTEWFVGLGWLLSRELFLRDWLPEWPDTHWDHWLRQDAVRKGRECLFPEVSRDFHIGEHGINMDAQHYKRYNGKVRLNDDPEAAVMEPSELVLASYEASLAEMLERGTIAPSLYSLDIPVLYQKGCRTPTIVYYAAGLSDAGANQGGRILATSPWKPLSNFFGLWHEPWRGIHAGMHRFHYKGRCILLVDASSAYAKSHMPAGTVVFGGQHFGAAAWARVKSNPTLEPLLISQAGTQPGSSK